jgi:hypothetical protein
MTENPLKVTSFTPELTDDRSWVVPVYQRCYSWEEAQVRQLLEDLWYAFDNESDKDYYLGNVVVAQSKDNETHLIDGQQRLTTLMLIGMVMGQSWGSFVWSSSKTIRLSYAIRPGEQAFLKQFAMNPELDLAKGGKTVNNATLNALNVIREFLKSKENSAAFSDFIWKHTRMVEIDLPPGTDLNKYFEVMNNRGEQLEHHEILKAQLLGMYDPNSEGTNADEDSEQEGLHALSRIWETCSQMGQYLEKGLAPEFRKLLRAYRGDGNAILEWFAKEGRGKEDKHTLDFILENFKTTNGNENGNTKNNPPPVKERLTSPVNFENFLRIVYVLHTKDWEENLRNRSLLKIFQSVLEKNDPKAFILDLLKYRILLDRFILKSATLDRETKWEIRHLRKFESSERREKPEYSRHRYLPRSTRIQSMLNVALETEVWLIPALKFAEAELLSQNEDSDTEIRRILDETFTHYLEALDHELAFARYGKQTLIDVSRRIFSRGDWKGKSFSFDISDLENKDGRLNRGTGTDSYWFFKLDYCLWKLWQERAVEGAENLPKPQPLKLEYRNHKYDLSSAYNNFQFRSNRSVEHLFPQSPVEDSLAWDIEDLHNFGNLALISVRSNSSFNNNLPEDKKEQFLKRSEQFGIESLKLLLMHLQAGKWTKDSSRAHADAMIAVLNRYHEKPQSHE